LFSNANDSRLEAPIISHIIGARQVFFVYFCCFRENTTKINMLTWAEFM